ncbi:MAG: SPASM domain-containing protein [Ruminococcaceae bacterium]|nr:SPASM domain-containing protein [Oscillospiraceae bacterium]
MDHVSLLIKPASGLCDMRCDYCFYRDDEHHARGVMTAETADALIANVFSAAQKSVSFAFQGGEPTLAGLAFFTHFVTEVAAKNVKDLPVSYAIQTSGLHIDEAWARFFAEHRFLVGLSLDGTSEIHDKHRRTASGEATFAAVAHAAELLQKAGAEFNILTVVTKDLCKQAKKVYAYLKKQSFSYQQYILCLAPLENPHVSVVPTAADYAKFLIDLFTEWYADWKRGEYRSIRYFDNLVRIVLGMPPELCSLRGGCTNQLVIESDGACYPCDFYVDEAYRLGNAASDPLDKLVRNDAARCFVADGAGIVGECRTCRWLALCRGGCRRERFGGEKTVYCEAYRRFFAACGEKLVDVARDIRAGKSPEQPM